ncbi:hypothetical protein [Nocardia terpenica]|uniref:Uncharacterized protein n=1 Tax=Nocardia terpenica TaxID=455432 RepID=A0A6G9ZEB0_9NOCA|nr:hypothetical protein [Nocardia terpenica]QIS23687.1 hypothetical protein F6W96_40845 [Nocardia terpenica]
MTHTTARKSKLDLLEALIEHPRTPENERRAAQAMLTRLLDKQRAEAKSSYVDPTWYGEKYDEVPRFSPTSAITKVIREEIKTIRKVAKKVSGDGSVKLHDPIGDAPAEIKFSVTTPHYGSINIAIRNIPDEWGWVREDRYDTGHVADWPSEALRTLGNALRALANAYNHDNSDTMTDYFDKRFFLSVIACKGDDLNGPSIA